MSLGDRSNSPVNGVIPGIFEHAMAYDNLMEFDEKYFKKNGFFKYIGEIILIFMAIIFSVYYTFRISIRERLQLTKLSLINFTRGKSCIRPIFGCFLRLARLVINHHFIFIFFITAVALSLLFYTLRLAPSELFSLLGISAIIPLLPSLNNYCKKK